MLHWLLVKNSRANRHSPERVAARICRPVSTYCDRHHEARELVACRKASRAQSDVQTSHVRNTVRLLSSSFVSLASWKGRMSY